LDILLLQFIKDNKEWLIAIISSPMIVLFFQKRESVFKFPIKYMSIYYNKSEIHSVEIKATKNLLLTGLFYACYALFWSFIFNSSHAPYLLNSTTNIY